MLFSGQQECSALFRNRRPFIWPFISVLLHQSKSLTSVTERWKGGILKRSREIVEAWVHEHFQGMWSRAHLGLCKSAGLVPSHECDMHQVWGWIGAFSRKSFHESAFYSRKQTGHLRPSRGVWKTRPLLLRATPVDSRRSSGLNAFLEFLWKHEFLTWSVNICALHWRVYIFAFNLLSLKRFKRFRPVRRLDPKKVWKSLWNPHESGQFSNFGWIFLMKLWVKLFQFDLSWSSADSSRVLDHRGLDVLVLALTEYENLTSIWGSLSVCDRSEFE